MAKMKPLALWRLRQFCEQHELDVQEIDNSISYVENKSHLEGFLMRTPEELAKEYGRMPTIIEMQTPNKEKKKKWIYREPKQKWITISKTHVEISSN